MWLYELLTSYEKEELVRVVTVRVFGWSFAERCDYRTYIQ
jgi:hypothetical protein